MLGKIRELMGISEITIDKVLRFNSTVILSDNFRILENYCRQPNEDRYLSFKYEQKWGELSVGRGGQRDDTGTGNCIKVLDVVQF